MQAISVKIKSNGKKGTLISVVVKRSVSYGIVVLNDSNEFVEFPLKDIIASRLSEKL